MNIGKIILKRKGEKDLNLTKSVKYKSSRIYIKEENPLWVKIAIATVIIVLIVVVYLGYQSHMRNVAWREGLNRFNKAEAFFHSNENETLSKYRSMVEYSLAIPLFEKSKKPWARFYIAVCKYRLGDTDEAISLLEDFSRYAPSDVVFYTLGKWYENKDAIKAQFYYTKVISDFPDSKYLVQAYFRKTMLLNDYNTIVSTLKNIVAEKPGAETDDVKFALADLLAQRGFRNADYYSDAVAYLNKVKDPKKQEKAQRKMIEYAELWIRSYGIKLPGADEWCENYKQTFANSPFLAEIYRLQVLINYYSKHYERVIAVAEEAERKFPRYEKIHEVYLHHGWAYRRLGKEELAYETFLRGIASSTHKEELYLEAGTSLERMEEYFEAKNLYTTMLSLFDDPYIRDQVEKRIESLRKFIG